MAEKTKAQRERKNELARAWWARNEASRKKALRRMRAWYWADPERERARKREHHKKSTVRERQRRYREARAQA